MGRQLLVLVVVMVVTCMAVVAVDPLDVVEVRIESVNPNGDLVTTVLGASGATSERFVADADLCVSLAGVEGPEDGDEALYTPFLDEALSGSPKAWVVVTRQLNGEKVAGFVFLQSNLQIMVNTLVIAAGLASFDRDALQEGSEYSEGFERSHLVWLKKSIQIDDVAAGDGDAGPAEYIRVSNQGLLDVDLSGFVVRKPDGGFSPAPLTGLVLQPGGSVCLIVYMPAGRGVLLDCESLYLLAKGDGSPYAAEQLRSDEGAVVEIEIRTPDEQAIVARYSST